MSNQKTVVDSATKVSNSEDQQQISDSNLPTEAVAATNVSNLEQQQASNSSLPTAEVVANSANEASNLDQYAGDDSFSEEDSFMDKRSRDSDGNDSFSEDASFMHKRSSDSESKAPPGCINANITTAKLNLDELETEYSEFENVSCQLRQT